MGPTSALISSKNTVNLLNSRQLYSHKSFESDLSSSAEILSSFNFAATKMISALSAPFTSFSHPRSHFSTSVVGSSLIQTNQSLLTTNPFNLSSKPKLTRHKSPLTVRASGDRGIGNSAATFIGGFVLGGITVATLGCIYAPQISKALTGEDRKDLMRKLPKFIYDEEKALEKTRVVLAKKIEQLNMAIDEASSQLHADDAPNGTAVNSDEIQAST